MERSNLRSPKGNVIISRSQQDCPTRRDYDGNLKKQTLFLEQIVAPKPEKQPSIPGGNIWVNINTVYISRNTPGERVNTTKCKTFFAGVGTLEKRAELKVQTRQTIADILNSVEPKTLGN